MGRGPRIVLAVALVIAVAGGAYAYRHRLARADQPDLSRLPAVTEVTAPPVPPPTAPSVSPSPPPPLPAAFRLGVPFTTQTPLADWPKHQESCEEANLIMVDAYWKGNRSSTLDPTSADRAIAALVAWQVKNWGSEDDLTDRRLGELARQFYGYDYEVLPIGDEAMRRTIVRGIPVLLGVTTHGLGNPRYPNFQTHHLVPGYSVSHFVTVVGYDDQGFILNDPGITPGHGYHVVYDQLLFAIDNLDQQRPTLDEGRVMLLIHPAG